MSPEDFVAALASLGGTQQLYALQDEDGNELTGELSAYAWRAFHQPQG